MNEVQAAPGSPSLVLVTGVGRSGTSMMSGTLHHLGLDVPGPFLGANASNPKGFFESRWAVRFHNGLAEAAGIYVFDARPEALDQMREVITDEHRTRLRAFLAGHLAPGRVTVVKDPRTVWTQALWKEQTCALGGRIGYIAMLRHPAEVAASRSTYYADGTSTGQRRRYQTASVARWINNTLISEAQTRGEARAFVRYTDMLADWRAVMRTVGFQVALEYGVDLDGPNPADDFIDPGLRRHDATWSGMDVPAALQELAQQVWEIVQELVEDPGSTRASSQLDLCAQAYQVLVSQASSIAQDWIDAAAREARAAAPVATLDAGPRTREDRLVRDVRARELLGVLASRGARRLRRRGSSES